MSQFKISVGRFKYIACYLLFQMFASRGQQKPGYIQQKNSDFSLRLSDSHNAVSSVKLYMHYELTSLKFIPAVKERVCVLHLTLCWILLQILTELEHSGVGRNKEQSARMLGHLVSNAPRLIRPYMEPILKVQLC